MEKLTQLGEKLKYLWQKERWYWLGAVGIGLMLTACYGLFFLTPAADRVDAAASLSAKVVRFHVLANSDTEEDQELKILVRDRVLTELSDILGTMESKEDTLAYLASATDAITLAAADEIASHGYDYPVKVSLAWENFPEKTYGEYTFPAGCYDALRIEIGDAQGQNWWCVLYPQMCLVDAVWGYDTEESVSMLKNVLTAEEYQLIASAGEEKTPKIGFAVSHLWQ